MIMSKGLVDSPVSTLMASAACGGRLRIIKNDLVLGSSLH